MVIKDHFELLKDTPNILSLSKAGISNVSVINGPRKFFVILKLYENKIDHYTKDRIYKLIANLEKRKALAIVADTNYSLHVSYNLPTKQQVINVAPFGIDDIYPSNPDVKNIYAMMVYSICFSDLITKKAKITLSSYSTISSFLVSMFVQMFGREYGLVGGFSSNIPRLKFFISYYVLCSFFGVDNDEAIRLAAISSGLNFHEMKNEIEDSGTEYDLSKITDFISCLSDFKVMPGINKYSFTKSIYKRLGINFIPALEDFSRFISTISASSMTGSNIVPTFIYKYNRDEYLSLLEITKAIFKKSN